MGNSAVRRFIASVKQSFCEHREFERKDFTVSHGTYSHYECKECGFQKLHTFHSNHFGRS